jgi:hypothetical protein
LLWTRGLAEVCQTAGADLDYVERETEAAGFAGFSPAFLVCAAKLITTGAAALGAVPPGAVTAGAVTPGAVTAEAMTLETVTPGANSAGAQPGGAESVGAELTLVEFAPASLAATTVRQRWRYLGRSSHEQSGLTVVVDSWTVLDRDTGMGGEVHLDGEVVLSAPGVELLARDISS